MKRLFRTILFDIDGVMLSEERYFDASALTVYEILFSPHFLGLDATSHGLPKFTAQLSENDVRLIRKVVFANDSVLNAMKRLGVNANWDMVYLQTTYQMTRLLQHVLSQRKTGEVVPLVWTVAAIHEMGQHLRKTDGVADAIDFAAYTATFEDCTSKAALFDRLDELYLQTVQQAVPLEDVLLPSNKQALWFIGQRAFQEWYLGDEYIKSDQPTGKRGFLNDEIPLIEPKEFSDLLDQCRTTGITLGIGTGRPEIETKVPLQALGWLSFFHPDRVTTATDVLRAEAARPDRAPLGKPNPYSYLRSYLATDDIEEILNHALPLPQETGQSTLVVGDSIADCLAARAMGCRFAAVLTGLEGDRARVQFEELGCEFIWNDISALRDFLREHSGR